MTSRTQKILQLAREENIKIRQAEKENRVTCSENISEEFNEGNFFYTFFNPVVKNETDLLVNGIDFDVKQLVHNFKHDTILENLNSNKSLRTLPNKPVYVVDFENDDIPDFDSDNSFKDPNYETKGNDEQDSESNDNAESLDDLLEEVGKAIEKNLLEDEVQTTTENAHLLEDEVQTTTENAHYDSKKLIQIKRNLGESYKNKSGTVRAKTCVPLAEKCRQNCKNKIQFEDQQLLFKEYWALGSYEKRVLYISSLITLEEKKSQTLKKSKDKPRNRTHIWKYHINFKGTRTNICQKCFLTCFDETPGFIKSVQKKQIDGVATSFIDKRGRNEPNNKLSDEVINTVKLHIESFPAYESHYTRRHTSKKYLSPDLTLSKMYALFNEKFNNYEVGLTSYSKIFHSLGLKFKSPKLDSCHTCDVLKSKIDIARNNNDQEAIKLQTDLDEHHNKADLAYKSKEFDKELAAKDFNIKTFTFDLQQCLPTPFLNTSLAFYKRSLWTFNLTVHDGTTGQPHCYMWHEALAKRGANEIGSCLFAHLNELKRNLAVNRVIFYSDSCPGQNRNSFLSCMFLTFLNNNESIKVIDHKFLLPGHTHMECDVDHSVIERQKKKTQMKIHHPRDWFNFVSSLGNKKKFKVIEMTKDHFWNFSFLLKNKFIWRKKSEDGDPFVWKDVKWLRYEKAHFGKIFYKTTLDEQAEFKVLNINKRGTNCIKLQELPKANEEIKIPSKKKKDILDLLPLLDPVLHPFYQNLSTDEKMPNVHPDLVDSEESDED